MIARYARPEMLAIWSDQSKYELWLEIEIMAVEAMAEYGFVPAEAARIIRDRAGFDTERIKEIEAETKHDVIAFLTCLAEHVGPEARFIHLGMTSSDILDTALSLQLTRASDLLLAGLDRVLAALKSRAFEHKETLVMGRSHGIHAEPTSFGLKLAGHYAEMSRNRKRLVTAREEIAVCALSGAVGNFASIDPRIEQRVASRLGLVPEPVSTQIIPRDRHAAFFAALAVLASGIERLAVEIRHLHRSEVREVEEYFAPGQKGSSAMPHKRNPILSENLTGLARLVRSALAPALENVVLWHERDISHSSVERGIAPDATIHLDFALHRLGGLIENLVICPQAMQDNIALLGGLHRSQSVLLALIEAGASREQAYALVQAATAKTWRGEADLQTSLAADPDISSLINSQQLAKLFKPDYDRLQIEHIFERVFA